MAVVVIVSSSGISFLLCVTQNLTEMVKLHIRISLLRVSVRYYMNLSLLYCSVCKMYNIKY